MNALANNPQVRVALDKAHTIAAEKKRTHTLTSVRQLFTTPEIQDLMEEILAASTLKEEYKTYLRTVFIKKKTHKQGMKEAFGADLGYQEEVIVKALQNHEVVKEFIDIMRSLYIQFVPVASLKEFEMILNPKTDDKVRYAAIQGVKETAGIGGNTAKGSDLPVNITINIPVQNNVQTNVQVQEGGGDSVG